jgi:hypothetical protein
MRDSQYDDHVDLVEILFIRYPAHDPSHGTSQLCRETDPRMGHRA